MAQVWSVVPSPEDVRYCHHCGSETRLVEKTLSRFDPRTGRELVDTFAVCPLRKGWLSPHTRSRVLVIGPRPDPSPLPPPPPRDRG